MKKPQDEGFDNNTIVAFTTDNGAENFTGLNGGQTPFAGGKGTALEGGFRCALHDRWPGRVPAGKVENGIMSGLDWSRLFGGRRRQSDYRRRVRKGKASSATRPIRSTSTGITEWTDYRKGPSARHSIFYFFHEGTLSAVRLTIQVSLHRSAGWLVWAARSRFDWPILINLRLDPFERTKLAQRRIRGRWHSYNCLLTSSGDSIRQAGGGKARPKTAIEFPPDAEGASPSI